jgi:predicted O-linked N-acetylglucosamine transferase (SPINDLY family)
VWRVWILPAHQLPQGPDAPNLQLVAETTDPRVVAMIESAAREHGVDLERLSGATS